MSKKLMKKTVVNGIPAFETYYISDYSDMISNKSLMVKFSHTFIDLNNVIQCEQNDHHISNENVFSMVIDPKWNSTSTPPKPDGFNIDDVSTWGDLTYDEIPLVKAFENQNYDLFLKYKDTYTIDQAILMTLSDLKVIPAIGANPETDWILR